MGGDDIPPPVVFSQGRQGEVSSMSKHDKKILIALVFAQTSVLAALIVLSPYFWIKKVEHRDDIRAQAEFGQFFKRTNNEYRSGIEGAKT